MTRVLSILAVIAPLATPLFAQTTPLMDTQVTNTQATPGPNCAPRQQVVERLASRYGETRQSIGLGANNQLVEVFASRQSGSWTITVTSAAGVTCLIASGQAFETLAHALAIPESDA